MDLQKAREEFSSLQQRIAAINHATSLIFFDGETTAPPDTAQNRIRSLEVLNEEVLKLKFGDETLRLLDILHEHEDELSLLEKRSLEILRRESEKNRLIPTEKYIKYESLLVSAQDAWHKANEDQNYGLFLPYLEEVMNTVIEFAGYCNCSTTPYDYCLDNYEPGINTQVYDGIFDVIKKEIPPLLSKIMEKPQVDDSCLMGDYSQDKQNDLATYIVQLLRLDTGKVGLSTADHPFSTNIGSHLDQRIVTKYNRKDFTQSLYTMLYECGHVLYEMGQPDDVLYTFIDGSASLGIMESQSQFYENNVGRSRGFIENIYPELLALFPGSFDEHTPEDIYLAVNKVNPGPIRMGSDEVTNSLHILIRYEIEKALFDKTLTVWELPDAWAEKYKKYLNVDVKNPVQGVLQDIHWAHGAIGYFPTAVLGSVYRSLIAERMDQEIDLQSCLKKADFDLINLWNKEHVWQKAGIYDTNTVMEEFVGVKVTPEPYIDYLKKKYSEIYKLD